MTRRRPNGSSSRAVTVRMDDDERASVGAECAKLGGISPSRYFMQLHAEALSGSPHGSLSERAQLVQLLIKHRTDLAKIGANLNQLAKVANTTGMVAAGDLDATLAWLRDTAGPGSELAAAVTAAAAGRRRSR